MFKRIHSLSVSAAVNYRRIKIPLSNVYKTENKIRVLLKSVVVIFFYRKTFVHSRSQGKKLHTAGKDIAARSIKPLAVLLLFMLLKKKLYFFILTFYERLKIRVRNIFFVKIVIFFPHKNIINRQENFIRKTGRNVLAVYSCLIFINFCNSFGTRTATPE